MILKRYFVEGLAHASYLVGADGEAAVVDPKRDVDDYKNRIDSARHIPLPQLPKRLAELPRDRAIATMCGSGYRSSIAASLLQKDSVPRVRNVMGGMGAWLEAPCPEWYPADLVFPGEAI